MIRAGHLGGSIDWLAHARNVACDLPATTASLARFIRDRYHCCPAKTRTNSIG
jgi:hypothetical protein